MFEEPKPPLNDNTRLSVMALAEEYQCVNLIKQCINEAEITPGNVLGNFALCRKVPPESTT